MPPSYYRDHTVPHHVIEATADCPSQHHLAIIVKHTNPHLHSQRKYVGSEVFAEDVLENICNTLEDKGRAMLEEFQNKTYSATKTSPRVGVLICL